MKRTLYSLLMSSVLCLVPFFAKSQSTMEFQPGTTIEVTAGADICADNVIINGTYSGTGTKCGAVLPVELVVMTAHAAKSAVTLNWTTATETNNYGFEIERRQMSPQRDSQPDGGLAGGPQSADNWKKVGFVKGAGASTSSKEYSFTDINLLSGRYAYRMKQIDNNGTFTYAPAAEVEVGLAPKEFTLSQNYPNPFNPQTTIEFTLPSDGRAVLKVYDIVGREVATLFDEDAPAGFFLKATFDGQALATGVYFARLQFGGQFLSRRIMLVK